MRNRLGKLNEHAGPETEPQARSGVCFVGLLHGGDDGMATMTARAILIKGGDIINEGVLHLQTFDARERKIRAAKMWGLMWLFALLSVPIIVAHFVLVPGFLIAGPVMAYRRYRLVEVPNQVTGMCPTNKEEINLPLGAAGRGPGGARGRRGGAAGRRRERRERY